MISSSDLYFLMIVQPTGNSADATGTYLRSVLPCPTINTELLYTNGVILPLVSDQSSVTQSIEPVGSTIEADHVAVSIIQISFCANANILCSLTPAFSSQNLTACSISVVHVVPSVVSFGRSEFILLVKVLDTQLL